MWLQYVTEREFTVDRMASRADARCQQFCSVSTVDPEAWAVSVFSVDWKWDKFGHWASNYCFPPFSFIPRILQHLEECGAQCVLLVPWWPSQAWWVRLQEMLVASWHFPMQRVFERVKDGRWSDVVSTSFKPLACLLDGAKKRKGS